MSARRVLAHPLTVTLILAAVVCLAVGGLARLGVLEPLELVGYDLLVLMRGFEPPAENIVVVDFDDASMAQLGTFPIPRAALADVVTRIASGNPDLIGVDVLLSEARKPEEDAALAAAIANAGNVIVVNNFGGEHLPASEPLPLFREAAFDVAFVNMPLDADGFIRRMYLVMRTPEFSGVSLPVALASNHLQQPLQPGREGAYRLGSSEIALDGIASHTALIGAWSNPPAATIPASALLAPGFDTTVLRGKIVLVGQSAAAGKDSYPTPVFRFRRPGEGRALLSGVEIHAAAVATLLTGKTIRVLDTRWLWALNALMIWLVASLVITVRPAYSIPAVLAGAFGTYLVALTLFAQQGVWMRFASTEAGILLALPAGLGYRFLEERRQKTYAQAERRELMGLFERYVSPEVAAEIWERRGEIVLSGQEKTATVLFTDIRNFTALSAGRNSADVLAWLNNYFNAMGDVIKKHGGFLNKFIGDGILVVFGVPLSDGVEADACRAVQAALDMVARVDVLNAEQAPGEPRIKIGVGIHTGVLTAGNVGARDRLEYSVIGETVNLASRLESLTKDFDTSIVLSPATYEHVRSRFACRALGQTAVRGFPGQISVYAVAAGAVPQPRATS